MPVAPSTKRATARASRTRSLATPPPSVEATPSSQQALTSEQLLLVALYRAGRYNTENVPFEELVLQAWRDFPSVFGLRNHPEHPDSLRIHLSLRSRLKPDGLVICLSDSTFRLTEKGGTEAALLHSTATIALAESGRTIQLDREQALLLQRARESRAFAAWRERCKDQIVERDVFSFFQFAEKHAKEDRALRVNVARAALALAREVGEPDAVELEAVAAYLADRYSYTFTNLW